MRDIDLIIIHCSATMTLQDIGAAEIDEWHKARGWSGIGYHLVIRRNGKLEAGRPVEQAGAHAKGHNARSIGICMVGGIDTDGEPQDNFSPMQYTTLRMVISTLKALWPDAEVKGHRDLPDVNKACPSFDVASWLDE